MFVTLEDLMDSLRGMQEELEADRLAIDCQPDTLSRQRQSNDLFQLICELGTARLLIATYLDRWYPDMRHSGKQTGRSRL